jgi:hypothetical protein
MAGLSRRVEPKPTESQGEVEPVAAVGFADCPAEQTLRLDYPLLHGGVMDPQGGCGTAQAAACRDSVQGGEHPGCCCGGVLERHLVTKGRDVGAHCFRQQGEAAQLVREDGSRTGIIIGPFGGEPQRGPGGGPRSRQAHDVCRWADARSRPIPARAIAGPADASRGFDPRADLACPVRERDHPGEASFSQAKEAGRTLPGPGWGVLVEEHLDEGIVRGCRGPSPGPVKDGEGSHGGAFEHHRLDRASRAWAFQPQEGIAARLDGGAQP